MDYGHIGSGVPQKGSCNHPGIYLPSLSYMVNQFKDLYIPPYDYSAASHYLQVIT